MVPNLKLMSTPPRWWRDLRALPHGLIRGLAVILAVGAGAAFFSAGWIVAAPDQGRVTVLEQSHEVAAPLCQQHAERMGLDSAPEGSQMTLSRPLELQTPERLVPLFEATLQGCRGYQLDALCLGAGCEHGSRMTLRYDP